MGTSGFGVFTVLMEGSENHGAGPDTFILYCSLQNGEGHERSEFIT